MDFLETNFKSQKIPKRNIRPHNPEGKSITINIKKYSNAFTMFHKFHFNNKSKSNKISIKKGEFASSIAQESIDVINKRIERQTDQDFKLFIEFVNELFKQNFSIYSNSPIKEIERFEDEIKKYIEDKFISPIINDVEDYITKVVKPSSSNDEENLLFGVIDDIQEIIFNEFHEDLREFFNNNAVNANDIKDINYFDIQFGIDFIIDLTKSYFREKTIDDLFIELNNLIITNASNDKTSIYFYFCDISFEKNVYPIFYTPCTLSRKRNLIDVTFDKMIFYNKKALSYILENHFSKSSNKPDFLNEDRIHYLADEDGLSLLNMIENITTDIVNTFSLTPDLNIKDSYIFSKNQQGIKISNNFHFSVFDKSDESMVNDYEEIINEIENDTPLSDFFNNLLKRFIEEDPISINQDINDQWDDMDLYDRLSIDYPIPVNEEQRKIISSIDNQSGKYVIVSGPPGTGKSHTISAIVFKQILDNKSVLILSDKKEALDVVEDKINNILSKSRHDINFQNPILRLGKVGNTYSKILSTTSLKYQRHP